MELTAPWKVFFAYSDLCWAERRAHAEDAGGAQGRISQLRLKLTFGNASMDLNASSTPLEAITPWYPYVCGPYSSWPGALPLSRRLALAPLRTHPIFKGRDHRREMEDCSERLGGLLDADWEWRLADLPEFATAVGIHDFDDRLDDRSLRAYERRAEYCARMVDRLQGDEFSASELNTLTTQERLSYRVLLHQNKTCETLLTPAHLTSHRRLALTPSHPPVIADGRMLTAILLLAACPLCLCLCLCRDLLLHAVVRGAAFKPWLCAINRLEGPHTELAQLIQYMKFDTPKDYRCYVERLKLMPDQNKQVLDLLREGIRTGHLPPLVGLEGVDQQLSDTISGLSPREETYKKSPFWRSPPYEIPTGSTSPVKSELKALQELERSAIGAIFKLHSSFQEMRRFITTEYIPAVKAARGDSVACLDLPSGSDWYEACLEFHTSSTRSAEEIHSVGLDEVTRIRKRMYAACLDAGMGQSEGSPTTPGKARALDVLTATHERQMEKYLDQLRQDKQFISPSPQVHVERYRSLCMYVLLLPPLPISLPLHRQTLLTLNLPSSLLCSRSILPKLPKLFSLRCMPRTPFAVEATPAAHADAAPSAYYLGGAGDGSRPGKIFNF